MKLHAALLLPILSVLLYPGFVSTGSSAFAADLRDLKVATFNVWGVIRPIIRDSTRFEDIPTELDRLDADVVVLQELFTSNSRRAANVRTYPHMAEGPSAGDRILPAGVAILSRWPIVRTAKTAFKSCAGTDCLAHKGAVIATVERPDGLRFEIMTTHLNAEGSADVRRRQIDDLRALADAYHEPGTPLVIGGDFNFSIQGRSDGLYDHLYDRFPAQDTYRAWAESPAGQAEPEDIRAGYTADTQLNGWLQNPFYSNRARIDMILLQEDVLVPQLRVSSARLLFNQKIKGRHLSDHFGVETTFEVSHL